MLEVSQKNNQIDEWMTYFSTTIIESQNHTRQLIEFLIKKAKLYETLRGQLNQRQEKALNRMFKEGICGFKGGLSAENYMAITKSTRPTTTRDLNDLVTKKALIKTGEFKGTRYFLNIKNLG